LLRSAICTASSAETGLASSVSMRACAWLRLVSSRDQTTSFWMRDCVADWIASNPPSGEKLAQPPSSAADSTASVSVRGVNGFMFMAPPQ
jgi:hypothetical protein